MNFRNLYLGFIGIVLISISGVVYNTLAIRQNEARIKEVMNKVYPYIEQLQAFEQLVAESKSLTTSWVYLKYAVNDKESLKKLHAQHYPQLKVEIEDSFQKLGLEEDQAKLVKLFSDFEELVAVQQNIMMLLPDNDSYEDPLALFEGEEMVESEVIPRTGAIASELDRLIEENRQSAQKSKEEMLESIQLFQFISVLIGSFIALLIFFSFAYVRNSITLPVAKMEKHVRELSLGRLPQIKELEEDTVVGDMSRALLKLTETFRETAIFAISIGQGEYQATYEKRSEEDFLGNALLEMKKELVAYSDMMEAKVAQRTKELEAANRGLQASEEELRQNSEELNVANDNLQKSNQKLEAILNELQEAQSQLVQAEKMSSLGQLTAGVAHEINNPINFVYAGIHSLKSLMEEAMMLLNKYAALSAQDDPEKLKASLQELEKQKEEVVFDELEEDIKGLIADITLGAERTQKIVQGLKVFSRMGGDGYVLADLHENIDATLTILGNKAHDKIILQKEYDEHLPSISCNISQLNQVFMNIITNAIQATEEGNIRIRTEKLGENRVAITIADTGMGMDEETKQKVFDPFFTTKDVGEGTGLGMSISFGIIESHNGTISVESEKGSGTTFRIELPIRSNKE